MTVISEEEKEEEAPPVEVEANESHKEDMAEDVNEDPDASKIEKVEEGDAGDDDYKENEEEEEKYVERIAADAPWTKRMKEVFMTFWPLGLTAFGGPQAHVAILRDHLVEQRGWMDEEQFTELFAIGQGLPGPTSTQLVISTATSRAGPLGGLLAFFLWNLPGLIVLTICGSLIDAYIDPNDPPWYLVGLPPAAITLVFKAMYNFAQKLDSLGIVLAMISCIVTILINGDENIRPDSSQYVFPSMLAAGGLITFLDSKRKKPFSKYGSPSKGWDAESDETMRHIGIPLWVGAFLFFFWAFILVLVICLVSVADIKNVYLEIFETMYRIGSIIFGGGQVVLPMLQDEVVPQWMTKDQFLQGLGLAQSMPGPLFNFSAYLGAVYKRVPGALIAWSGLFSPGIILIFAVVPFWARLRHLKWFKAVLKGVNSTAIGLVGAACVLLWEAAIVTYADAMVFCFAGTLAVAFSIQAPIVVFAGGCFGAILHKDAASLGQVTFCEKQGFVREF